MAGRNNIEFAGLSDIGQRRSSNQDAFAILAATDTEQWLTRGYIFLVADGMGAHAVGELASKMAADSIPHIYAKHAHEGPTAALRRAFVETNTNIHTRGQANREFEGMGTTGTALLLRPEGAWISHVGDSRVYRVRDGQMEQLSFDHSLVWEMARRQRCKPEDLPGIPNNVIVRSLGPEPLVQIDIEGPHPVKSGDIFILCSDGLSGPLSDDEIGAIASSLPPAEACRLLIDMANLHGGPDNITCIVVHVGDNTESGNDSSAQWNGVLSAKRRVWYERIPWPMASLGLGILLAVAAIFLTINQIPAASMAAFLFAALTLILGLAGILFQHKREEESRLVIPTSGEPPKIYRQTSCIIKAPLLDKLAEARSTLKNRVQEQSWKADWNDYERHQQLAEAFQQKKKFHDAFRESCLALRVLTETIQKNRR